MSITFHFFIDQNSYRYIKRESDYGLHFLYKDLWIVNPQWGLLFRYYENSFRDNINLQPKNQNEYQRLKQAHSYARTNYNFSITPHKASIYLKFFRNLNFGGFRELQLDETSVPFTAQTGLLEERFGLSNKFNRLGARAYDLFSYPIWHGFLSKQRTINNYSNAREYIQNVDFSFRDNVYGNDIAFQNYNQNITFQEKIYLNANLDIRTWLDLVLDTSLSQNIVRLGNVGTLPTHLANINVFVKQKYNLMEFLDFSFWKTQLDDTLSNKVSILELNFQYENIRYITQNNIYHRYTPKLVLLFNWFDSRRVIYNINLDLSFGFIRKNYVAFFHTDSVTPDDVIYDSIAFLNQNDRKNEFEMRFSLAYLMGLRFLKHWFEGLTQLELARDPTYMIEILLEFKRLDFDIYTNSIKNPSDAYILNQVLDMNLHKNVSGRLSFKTGFDIIRDPLTNNIQYRLFSLEIGLALQVIF